MPRTAFPGYDDPVNIDLDPEDALRALLSEESSPSGDDGIEPALDD
jgi:hypothetical protein